MILQRGKRAEADFCLADFRVSRDRQVGGCDLFGVHFHAVRFWWY
jgi:hypothetical protein